MDQNIRAVLRVHLWFENDEGMLFGLGRVHLLESVQRLGSLHRAAKELGMSYRAAWGRIKRTEEALGAPVLEKVAGSKGYSLTPLGTDLLRRFAQWYAESERFALDRARELMPWSVEAFESKG